MSKIYRGPIDNIKLNSEEIINNSEYFVLKPSFTTMSLPKTRIKIKKEGNNQGENTENRIEMRESTNHDIEDLANAPDKTLYMGIGFNKNDNKFHTYNIDNKEELMIKLGENIKNKEEEEAEELIPKETYYEMTNNKKHYRRKYNIELEKVKELKLRPPFITCSLMRNKYIDTKLTANSLFEIMRNDDGKIIQKFIYGI